VLGAFLTARGQKAERRNARIRQQVDEFYAPLLAMRVQILTKSTVRTKIEGAASAAWRQLAERTQKEKLQALLTERFPDWEKIIAENNRQLVEELFPTYRQMIDVFSTHMGLAEPSTRLHFGALVEFVDVWDGWIKDTIPKEVVEQLGHSEDNLAPFYQELYDQLDRLSKALKPLTTPALSQANTPRIRCTSEANRMRHHLRRPSKTETLTREFALSERTT
jgi:hypothetical protein